MKRKILTLARSIIGKAVWNLLIEAASGVSGHPDDHLHGYVTLERSGAFGVNHRLNSGSV